MSTLINTPHYALPLPAATNTLVEDVARLISALGLVDTALYGQQAQITASDFTLPALSAAGTFSPEGLVLTWTETLWDDRERVTTYVYLGNGLISTETVVIGALTRVVTYEYDLNDKLIGWTTVES